MTVWDDLVGQEKVSEQLDAAARDADALVTAVAADTPLPEASKMTHAWLFTGPPGSGRSTAARAFAAALQCVSPDRALGGVPGCGFCDGCHTSLIGTHADVQIIRTDLLSIGVKETRDLVRRAQLSPAGGRWQVIIVEDADRLTEGAGNVLLKAVEEPAPRTVWLLCAPSIEDVLPTIRSRCRHLTLRTPPVDAVADVLVRRDGIEPDVAAAVARATQGHIGRARRLATDERARARRAAVLKLPLRVDDVGGCLKAAQELIDAASEDAKQVAEEIDVKETEDMKAALGASQGGRMPRGTAGVMKELEDKQKRRTHAYAARQPGPGPDRPHGLLPRRTGPPVRLQPRPRQHGDAGHPGPARARLVPESHPAPDRGDRRLPRGPRPQCGAAAGGGGDDDGAAGGLTRPRAHAARSARPARVRDARRPSLSGVREAPVCRRPDRTLRRSVRS